MTISKFIAVQGTIKIIKISELPRRGNMIVEKFQEIFSDPVRVEQKIKTQSIDFILNP